jgi:hypothetical protein
MTLSSATTFHTIHKKNAVFLLHGNALSNSCLERARVANYFGDYCVTCYSEHGGGGIRNT